MGVGTACWLSHDWEMNHKVPDWLPLVGQSQAEAQQADSVDVINEWAARVTKGLIKMAVPPGTPFDMVLTNAVYFKVGDH